MQIGCTLLLAGWLACVYFVRSILAIEYNRRLALPSPPAIHHRLRRSILWRNAIIYNSIWAHTAIWNFVNKSWPECDRCSGFLLLPRVGWLLQFFQPICRKLVSYLWRVEECHVEKGNWKRKKVAAAAVAVSSTREIVRWAAGMTMKKRRRTGHHYLFNSIYIPFSSTAD